MKILLCYSRDHFDPSRPPIKQESWGISANILARVFFETLSKLGDVTYSDGFDYEKHTGENYDLLVAIERNFSKLLDVCSVKQSILIAVNMHPKERNTIISNFAKNELHKEEAIAAGDLVDAQDISKSIDASDAIICFGNTTVYNSYLKNGVPHKKIKMFNYGLLDDQPKIKRPQPTKRFLYAASRIGLRKGFDIVYELCVSMKSKEFHLDLAGQPTSEFYQKKIDRLVQLYPEKVTYHAYVPANSSKYRELFQSNDFLLFPSLEEGQAGTTIEGMFYGLIPLITADVGTDFAPLGFLEPKMKSKLNATIMSSALSLSKEDTARLKLRSSEYYSELHTSLADLLYEAFQNFKDNGSLYPAVSLILPIFNKADTIKELIKLLDAAAKAYPNTEAHIIFDGCVDDTESVVKKFYAKTRGYDVLFYTTPDIFEIKTNNLGFKNSTGKYAVIVQDDNYIYDKHFIFEAVQFLDKNPTCAILGCLAGVNFYPLGTKDLRGPGQITLNDHECYWRQDEATNPEFKHEIFEVDACMRGPLFFRKSFLESHGYLDEIFAPLYQDDMDICFRARKYGSKVYCMIMDVTNKSLTMANYDSIKGRHFARIMERNADIFYSRWRPSKVKDYARIQRPPMWRQARKRNFWEVLRNAVN